MFNFDNKYSPQAGLCLYGNDIDEGTTPIEVLFPFFILTVWLLILKWSLELKSEGWKQHIIDNIMSKIQNTLEDCWVNITSCLCCSAAAAVCIQGGGLSESQQNRKSNSPNLAIESSGLIQKSGGQFNWISTNCSTGCSTELLTLLRVLYSVENPVEQSVEIQLNWPPGSCLTTTTNFFAPL